MQLKSIPLGELIPAPYNPRKPLKKGQPGYERLRRSLEEFDLVQPIVWNRLTGHVVGGHQRLQILRDRGDESVDCVVVELSLEREKALNVALNNAQVGGEWDQQKLTDLVAELQALPDFDATLTGFSEADLKHLTFQPAATTIPVEAADADSELVRVTLEIPPAEWESVRRSLDTLLADHEGLRLHVREAG